MAPVLKLKVLLQNNMSVQTINRDAANKTDHGFNHLNISPATLQPPDKVLPPRFKFATTTDEAHYLNVMRDKLAMARNYILKEQELNLDPDRPGAHKQPVIAELEEPPIRIIIAALQRIRMLMQVTKGFKERWERIQVIDKEMENAMHDYWAHWTDVRSYLTWQTPGRDVREQERRADAVMEAVFEKCAEP